MAMSPRRSKPVTALCLAAAVAAAPVSVTALAQSQGGGEQGGESPEELAREGAERLMQALEGLLKVIPQYGMPRIEDNGDIVIPRLNPPSQREEEDDPSEGEDETITETDI
jgi:hypothetical protein